MLASPWHLCSAGTSYHHQMSLCWANCVPFQGFLVYRLLMPMVNEAFFLLSEGVGSAEDIDRSMRLGTNMQLGPLKLADQIGGLMVHGVGQDRVGWVGAGWGVGGLRRARSPVQGASTGKACVAGAVQGDELRWMGKGKGLPRP